MPRSVGAGEGTYMVSFSFQGHLQSAECVQGQGTDLNGTSDFPLSPSQTSRVRAQQTGTLRGL